VLIELFLKFPGEYGRHHSPLNN